MAPNVCGLDRLTRLIAGPALVVAGTRLRRTGAGSWRRLLGLVATLWGLELTLTGLVQWCPLNAALGVDTCDKGWVARYRERFGPALEEGAATATVPASTTRPR